MQLTRALKRSFTIRPYPGLASPLVHLRSSLTLDRLRLYSSGSPRSIDSDTDSTTTPKKESFEGPTPIDKTSAGQPLTAHTDTLPSPPPPLQQSETVSTSKDTLSEDGKERRKQTIAERDAEMMQKMLDRDGGQSTLSTEDGAWTGLKTHVKNNMFRVI